MEIRTKLTDTQIAARVTAVAEYERFAVLELPFRDEHHQNDVLAANRLQVTSADGSVYFGHVEGEASDG